MLRALWSSLGEHLPPWERLSQHIAFSGPLDPVLPSSFRVAAASQASIGACAMLARQIGIARNLRIMPSTNPVITLDSRHALAEFRSERYLRLIDHSGKRLPPPPEWNPLSGEYKCRDGRYIRTHCNFPHHRDIVLKTLGFDPADQRLWTDRTNVAAKVAEWDAFEFEEAVTRNGGCVAAMRSPEEWAKHPHSAVVRSQPLVSIRMIPGTESQAPVPFSTSSTSSTDVKYLGGIRILDLTRVVAGPVAGRCLAAHGATVLKITSPELPGFDFLDIDTGRGKANAQIHLPGQVQQLESLVADDCDVFLQSYRPGALGSKGFSAEKVAQLRPGIVYASLSAYGTEGPWAGKRGFDSLVQTATGINYAEAEAFGTLPAPRVLPCQALDHASGYLLAAGIMSALLKRATVGGSWEVNVSLARTAHWLSTELGRVDLDLEAVNESSAKEFGFDEVEGWGLLEEYQLRGSGECDKAIGVKHAAQNAAAGWTTVAIAGTDRPVWPEKLT